jgi:hypothetical protein
MYGARMRGIENESAREAAWLVRASGGWLLLAACQDQDVSAYHSPLCPLLCIHQLVPERSRKELAGVFTTRCVNPKLQTL